MSLGLLPPQRVSLDQLVDRVSNFLDGFRARVLCIPKFKIKVETYKTGVIRVDLVLVAEHLLGASVRTFVKGTISLLPKQVHLTFEDYDAPARVGHANALSQNVLLHDALCLGVVQGFANVFGIEFSARDFADHFVQLCGHDEQDLSN